MGKPVKLNDKKLFALLVEQGAEAVQAYFLQITEEMRQDLSKQLEDVRERVWRLEAAIKPLDALHADVSAPSIPPATPGGGSPVTVVTSHPAVNTSVGSM